MAATRLTPLERALASLARNDLPPRPSPLGVIDARAVVAATLLYLTAMLSTPLHDLPRLLLFGLYPVVMAATAGLGYRRLALRSCVALPFVATIGIVNLLYEREAAFAIGGLVVTRGLVSFTSLCIRALWSLQALMVAIAACGLRGICTALARLGLPPIFVTQLLLLHRYLRLLLSEALAIQRSRDARTSGRGHTLKIWGAMVMALLVRTFSRSERLRRAMVARGFRGEMPTPVPSGRWNRRDTLFLLTISLIIILLRTL